MFLIQPTLYFLIKQLPSQTLQTYRAHLQISKMGTTQYFEFKHRPKLYG